MSGTIQIGSYVAWEDKDGKSKQGLVTGKEKDGWAVRQDGKKTSERVPSTAKDLAVSSYAAMTSNIMGNIREIAENTVVNGIALRLFFGKDFFGQQSVSFLAETPCTNSF